MGVLNHAPWGGIIVLPVVEGRIGYVVSILIGAFATALLVNALKKENVDDLENNLTSDIDEVVEIELENL